MALKTIIKKVVSFCEIPEEVTENHWINEHHNDAFVEVHIDTETHVPDKIQDWLVKNYPELIEEDSFFIHMDY